jgi:DNA-binding FadR family transcriptional regulator
VSDHAPIGRSAPDDIADRLRARVNSGQLGPGDRLPNERVLAAEFGVARLTLREGIKRLTEEGYITSRRGNTGGTFVTDLSQPQSAWLVRMRRHPERAYDLMEYRKAVETRAAALAAQHRTESQVTILHASVEAVRQPGSRRVFRAADHEFHLTIGEACGSPRLRDAILAARGELFMPADTLDYEDHFAQTWREHRAITRAIEAGHGAAASRAMERHLDGSLRDLRDLLLDD